MSSILRRAASVILTRPGPAGGLEIFLLRRAAGSTFVPNAFVFPGGAVDPGDADERNLALIDGLGEARLQREFRVTVSPALPTDAAPPDARERAALVAAALRELFEEAGILLAAAPLRQLDRSVAPQSLFETLRAARQRADATALTLFSHWVTPPSEIATRRFDAYFFLARAPHDQFATADANETHDGIWIAPLAALERARAGDLHLVFPTIKHLERLAEFGSIDRLFEFARTKPIVTIMPTVGEGPTFALPPELENVW